MLLAVMFFLPEEDVRGSLQSINFCLFSEKKWIFYAHLKAVEELIMFLVNVSMSIWTFLRTLIRQMGVKHIALQIFQRQLKDVCPFAGSSFHEICIDS